jgi:hypothetical protein
MSHLPDDARCQRTEEYVARTIAGETVLVPIRQQIGDLGEICTLNEVATFIWERLADRPTAAEIAAALEETFEAEAAQIRQDLEEFLEQLLSIRAIQHLDASPDAPGPTPPR